MSETMLDKVDLNNVPKDELIRLNTPVYNDGDAVCLPGDYFMVRSPDTLPFEIQIMREELNKRYPDTFAFAILQTRRDIFVVLPFVKDIHDGSGFVTTSGSGAAEERIKPGHKNNIKLTNISGEKVPASVMKTGDLPKNRKLFLAADYHRFFSDGQLHLHKLKDTGGERGTKNIMILSVTLYKGSTFELHEKDGKLLFVTDKDEVDKETIDPNSELEVFISDEFVAYERSEYNEVAM